MQIGIPQVIVLFLFAVDFGVNVAKHGERKPDRYSVPTSLFSTGIMIALLWWGGFFQ